MRYDIRKCEDIDDFTDIKFLLDSLVHHRNIFGSSSKVFGNLRRSLEIFGIFWKMFGNVCLAFETILVNLRKIIEKAAAVQCMFM